MNFSRISGSFSNKFMEGKDDKGVSYDERVLAETFSVPVTISGLVWKRREGMGKALANLGKVATSIKKEAWEWRSLELRGTKLVYYYSDLEKERHKKQQESQNWLNQAKSTMGVQSSDVSKPRGIFDLKEEKAGIYASYGHSGAPSPFCISIQVHDVAAAQTRFKFAFESFSEQMEWLAAMTKVSVQASVDAYNVQLLQAVSIKTVNAETDVIFEHQPSVREPPQGAGDGDSGHRLWMMDNITIQKSPDGATEDQLSVDELKEAKSQVAELTQKLQVTCMVLDNANDQVATLRQTVAKHQSSANDKSQQKAQDELLAKEKATSEQLRQELDEATKKSAKFEQELLAVQEDSKKTKEEAEELNTELQHMKSTTQKVEQLQNELTALRESHEKEIQDLREEHTLSLEQQKASLDETIRIAVEEKEKALAEEMSSTLSANSAAVENEKKELQTKIDDLSLENKLLSETLAQLQSMAKDSKESAVSNAAASDDDDLDEFQDCE